MYKFTDDEIRTEMIDRVQSLNFGIQYDDRLREIDRHLGYYYDPRDAQELRRDRDRLVWRLVEQHRRGI